MGGGRVVASLPVTVNVSAALGGQSLGLVLLQGKQTIAVTRETFKTCLLGVSFLVKEALGSVS